MKHEVINSCSSNWISWMQFNPRNWIGYNSKIVTGEISQKQHMHIRDEKMKECMKSMDRSKEKRKSRIPEEEMNKVREKMNWIGLDGKEGNRREIAILTFNPEKHKLSRVTCAATPNPYATQYLLRRCDRNGDCAEFCGLIISPLTWLCFYF